MVKPEEIHPKGYPIALQSRRLSVKRGWDTSVADAVTKLSLEEENFKRYPRDSRGRFPDRARANKWYADNQPMQLYTIALGRVAYILGVGWVAPPEDTIPNIERAFTLRMSQSAGGGLAVDFGRTALLDFDSTNPDYDGDIGLKIDRDYSDDIKIYEALDFKAIGKPRPTEQFVTMIRPGYSARTSVSSRSSRRRT